MKEVSPKKGNRDLSYPQGQCCWHFRSIHCAADAGKSRLHPHLLHNESGVHVKDQMSAAEWEGALTGTSTCKVQGKSRA
ncbi:hypothetical protein [Arthrobacter cryoconiti]|uniref:Uncharacterized protein n=1 Tax=Arthrobacter cryoconiti TaxID=748907 RepID=A0ABV8R2Q5_9MICC|nr:hypothetical protein [Arthrobacter cryoconiti]MCC9067096.1 hypothetical protein [Arthrobacter cryoconiti]